ncbi:MAG TPA: endolytic transglycosylase MltG, partial [Nitrospirota bacterium]
SDPTVQFALGYNAVQQSWWTNPLSTQDLQVESPFNTYKYAGLPPAPISNPGESSLKAVAYPPQTNYYYFRARCDGSGEHVFAQTFDEHLANACP